MGSDVEVTKADRLRAVSLVEHDANCTYSERHQWPCDCPAEDTRNDVARALAEERAKARAPFLAVADEIHERGTAEVQAMDDEPDEYRKNQCASRAATYARAEHLIRRAAEEG